MLYLEVLILHYSLSVISIKVSPCARWDQTGITVAGNGKSGNDFDQLSYPDNIFIHNGTNTLYVADSGNERIQMLSLDNLPNTISTVVSTEPGPAAVYVDDDIDGPTIYVSLTRSDTIKKWVQNATSGIRVGEDHFCFGLSVDKEKNIYITDYLKNCVFKWSPQTNISMIVAGQENEEGITDRDLTRPVGIYINQNTGTLYVADQHNHRIQKWTKNAEWGVTVAGSKDGVSGSDAASLDLPSAVEVDDETQVVYVVDKNNHRIQKWLPGASEGETIAGGLGKGDGADQLSEPLDLAFDKEGNLYVSDNRNHRVQMFKMIDNQPCHENSTVSTRTRSTSIETTTTTVKSHAVHIHCDLHLASMIFILTIISIIK